MARIVYIGDETTAAGFRLAGLDTRVAAPGDAAETLRQAVADGSDCILLSAMLAGYVPAATLATALTGAEPLFALVPDIRGRGAPPDLAHQVRAALGIDT
jgi:vacuolar-type H+-ATPase subunit F/Vma7